jgi:hypothetical protein
MLSMCRICKVGFGFPLSPFRLRRAIRVQGFSFRVTEPDSLEAQRYLNEKAIAEVVKELTQNEAWKAK